jgi:hypothetical protein
MEILKALEGVELNEEQTKALDAFFKEYSGKLKKQYSEGTTKVDPKLYIKKADAEKAFALFEADCEKAFNMFEKDAEKAFGLFENDAEKAFNLFQEDKEKEYTDRLANVINEVYSDLEDRTKREFMESKEYKTLKAIKEMVLPLLEGTDNELVEKLKSISEEKEKVESENMKLHLEKVVSTLIKDIPAEYSETVSKFIAEGSTEEEIISRFNTILEMIEIKESKSGEVSEKSKFARKQKPINEEAVKKEEKNKPTFTSKTQEESKKTFKKKEGSINAFTESEEKLLSLINMV